MLETDRAELCRIVRAYIDPKRPGHKPKQVWQIIEAAHNGRPDGYLVTSDNMWLFRQYRNSVTGSPQDLIDEAMLFQEEKDNVPHV
jgi:hypothetical protein